MWKPYFTCLGLVLNPFGSPLLARWGFGLGLGTQTRVFPAVILHVTEVAMQVAHCRILESGREAVQECPPNFLKINERFLVWEPYFMRLGLDLNPFGSPVGPVRVLALA